MIKKSCFRNPVLVKFQKKCSAEHLPVISNIINSSLETTSVPDIWKFVPLSLRMKNDDLDIIEFSSFRPTLNL